MEGASFKIFSNRGRITPKFKLLGEEIRYLKCAEGGKISTFRKNIYPCTTFVLEKVVAARKQVKESEMPGLCLRKAINGK